MIGMVLMLIALAGAPAAGQSAPPGAGDPRLRTIPFDAGQVVRLRVAMGFQATVIFGPDERIENVAIGDSDSWQVRPNNRGDHLFLKPTRLGGTTNLTVITDARIYSFELSAAAGPTSDTPFTIRFLYPEAASPTHGVETAPSEQGRYRLSGDRAIRPDAISDDGVRTSIEWLPDQTLPAVFAVDDSGRETLLDGQMRSGSYVIDAVHPTLIFRLDRRTARASRLPTGRAR